MFGFVKPPRHPLSDVRSAERWLGDLATNDPLGGIAELVRELGRIADPTHSPRPSELQALFFADANAGDMRRQIIAQYLEHATRSETIERKLWDALIDLTNAFLQAFAACEREALRREHDAKWQALLPELLAREVMQLAFEAKLRMLRYEQWIPGKWAELHARFALARARRIHRQRLMLPDERVPITIERKYIATLLLHVCNAGNLDRAQLEWVSAHLDNWCMPLRMRTRSPGTNAFFIDLAQRHGLRRRGTAPLEGEVLFLETDRLCSLLRHYILAVEQKIRSQPLSAKTPRRIERLALLTKLAAQVDPAFRPVPRRGERMAATGEIHAIVGLANVLGYLREEEQRRAVPELDTVGSFTGTIDIAVFGRVRKSEDQRKELARRRLAAFSAQGGPWQIRDVSATGMRVVAPMAAAGALTLGMLVGLRADDDAVWKLGIVRRMRRISAERAEVGLQRIADSIAGVDLKSERGDADNRYIVEGETVPRRDGAFRALFLALHEARRGEVVQSLILPIAEYHAGKRFRLQTPSSSYPIRFGRLIEQQSNWVWTAIEPLPIAQSHPVALSAAAD